MKIMKKTASRTFVLSNLKAAASELESVIQALEGDESYKKARFIVEMAHAFHHLNFAVNVMDVKPKVVAACSRKNFNKWSKWPKKSIKLLRLVQA